MQQPQPLFRAAAVAANRSRAVGRIVLARPVSFIVLTAAACAAACSVALLFVWGSYTQHSTLVGQLVPESGIIKVHAPQPGVVVQKEVGEGQAVDRGQLLYVVSSELSSRAGGATRQQIARQLELRRNSLLEQVRSTRLLAESETRALEHRIALFETELVNLREMSTGQHRRLALAAEAAARYEVILERGFVSLDQFLVRQEDLLEQRTRLQSLERERLVAARQLEDLRAQAATLPLRFGAQVAELERAVAAVEQEIAENEARRGVRVEAPARGIATAVLGELGQPVDGGRPLLSIVPNDSALQAHLYAPSRAVGFVNTGDEVLLRYPAFPYQKFGHHRGSVAGVSRTALPAAELPDGELARALAGGEPVYRIIVELHSQAVDAYGRPHPLQPGMVVEADVLQETRRLYEWVLEPLYTLAGKVH